MGDTPLRDLAHAHRCFTSLYKSDPTRRTVISVTGWSAYG